MKIEQTKDGSHTLVSEEFGALYHSSHGSFQEAKHIFIENGIAAINKQELKVFEMGFGSGLNAILSYYYAKQHHLKLTYIAIEAFPVPLDIVKKLNYNKLIKESDFDEKFMQIHRAKWEEEIEIDSFFVLKKIKAKLEDYNFKTIDLKTFDTVYFDAFSPNDQEDLWTESIFSKMYQILLQDAFLITYCAKGVVKRTLKKVGFKIEALSGPIGKREITKAIKQID